MKRWMTVCAVFAGLALGAGCAEAGAFSAVKGWITGEVAALLASAALAVLGGVAGALFTKIFRTFRESGEFLAALGGALEDKRLTREELATLVKEGRDIFDVWR